MIHGGHVDSKWEFFNIFYPATGAVLAVSLKLLTEDFKHRGVAIVTQIAVHLLWLGISLYLAQFDKFSFPQFVSVAATVVTMVLSVFVLSFYRKDDDVPFWNFSGRTFVAMVIGFLVGGVLTLGLILFAQSLDWLFGVTIKDYVFADIPSVCMVIVAPLLFMSQIPDGASKRINRFMPFSSFTKGVVQYLFFPLLALYLVTLYVYACMILFTWQLPVGWVTHLVTASMLGMVILLYITYPLQLEQGKSFLKSVMRWMPLVMLPLLVLMSVAIGRRLSDYGITVSRLYVLVFNIWCYVVCIGLLIVRNKRIWWIPASFAAVLFLISVGPQSLCNITKRQLLGEVHKAFSATGVKNFPLTGEQYEDWLKTADPKVAASIDSKLDYLQKEFGYTTINELLGKDAVTGSVAVEDDTKLVTKSGRVSYYNSRLIENVALPQGYTRMDWIDLDDAQVVEVQGDRLLIAVQMPGMQEDKDEYQFELSLRQLIERDNSKNQDSTALPLIVDNGKAALVVNGFSFDLEDGTIFFFRCSGLLLTK